MGRWLPPGPSLLRWGPPAAPAPAAPWARAALGAVAAVGGLAGLGWLWPETKAMPRLIRSEEHTSELQSRSDLVCRLLLEKKKKKKSTRFHANRMGVSSPRSIAHADSR